MKRRIVFIAILFLTVLWIAGCNQQKEIKDSTKFKEEYEALNKEKVDGKEIRKLSIPENNPFVYKSAEELVTMIENKETFAVYFGFSSCPWCRSVLPALIKAAEELEIDTIYYVDVQNIRNVLKLTDDKKIKTVKEGSAGYQQLLKKLDKVLNEYTLIDEEKNTVSTDTKRIYAPNVISVVAGNAKRLETGISKKQTDPYMKLTEEIEQESIRKFKQLLQDITSTTATCNTEVGC